MKKQLFNKMKSNISIVLLLPFILILILFMLLYTPFDFIKYKKSHYYKDTKEKYTFLSGDSIYIKLYNLIKDNNLTIEYFRYSFIDITAYGYFKYNDILIFADYDVFFDEDKNQWCCGCADDEAVLISNKISTDIENFNLNFNYDIKKSVVLVDEEIYNDIIKCDFNNVDFIAVNNNDYISALKTIITTY